MKKCALVVMALFLMVGAAHAAQIQKTLTNETLDTTNTDTGWLQSYIGDSDRVAFFVTRNADCPTAGVTVEVTLQVSADGTNWTDIKWYDLAGGTTAQVTETISNNGTYLLWLDRDIAMPHVRIKVVGSATSKWPTDAGNDDCEITITEVTNK